MLPPIDALMSCRPERRRELRPKHGFDGFLDSPAQFGLQVLPELQNRRMVVPLVLPSCMAYPLK